MFNLLRVFFIGMFISFLGSLPLGSLNVAAMQVAVEENTKRAIHFALGVAIVEIIYVRICLKAMDWVMANRSLFHLLEWLTVILFAVLAVSSFVTASKKEKEKKNILLNNRINRFWLGFMMSAINPVQIPFWFIWSTYLLSNKILLPTEIAFNTYTAGIGIGTLAGLSLFIFFGKWVVNKIKAGRRGINFFVAIVFLISAILQLYKLLYHSSNI